MNRLLAKVAIVTGGASGIGEAVARLFVAEGARVTISDIQVDRGEALAAELGDAARFSLHDVSDPADWARVVRESEDAFGPINILINNAALPGFQKSISDISIEEYRRVFEVNQNSVLLGIKTVLSSMKRAGGGSIANTSSAYGLVGARNNIDYCGTKWAVTGMSKAAAIELADDNIRVNSVHPGPVQTPMSEATLKQLGATPADFAAHFPTKRWADPSELAEVFLFLASDASSFVTGLAFAADGGQTAQ